MVHLAQWNRLRPTQGAIGYVQVLAKRASFLALPPESRRSFAQDQAIKVVRGPTGRLHVIDHHHWARAWFDMGLPEAPVNIAEDFSGLAGDPFLQSMSEHGWLHPFDALGCRIPLAELPESVGQLPDDVFQSLAAFIRTAGRRLRAADAGRGFHLLPTGGGEGSAWFRAR